MTSELKNEIIADLQRYDLGERTIKMYLKCLVDLSDFYPKKHLSDVTLDELGEFFAHNKDKLKRSAENLKQYFHAIAIYYNKLQKKNFDLSKIPRDKIVRSRKDYFRQSEIKLLIDNATITRDKILLSLAYSSGLDLNEVIGLQIKDFDFKKNVHKVRAESGTLLREAVLSTKFKEQYQAYLEEYKPTKWLFEGRKKVQIPRETVTRIFNDNFKKLGLSKNLTFKSLKYSYILHLEEFGIPLLKVLTNLGLKSSTSLQHFSHYKAELFDKPFFSPLDRIYLVREESDKINTRSLYSLLNDVKDKDEKDYLIESIKCLETGALRSGIVFAWVAAIRNIHGQMVKHGHRTLNVAIKKHSPNAIDVKTIDDFLYIKDSVTLKAALDLDIFDKSEKDVLEECLNLRNKCGHPGQYKPRPLKAMAFLEDLITIVFQD
jgi:site-specific recombinase XerD